MTLVCTALRVEGGKGTAQGVEGGGGGCTAMRVCGGGDCIDGIGGRGTAMSTVPRL